MTLALIAGGIVVAYIAWIAWAIRTAPDEHDLWPSGVDEPWGKPVVRRVTRAIEQTGDDAGRATFEWPRPAGRPLNDHLLDAEHQRGPFDPERTT